METIDAIRSDKKKKKDTIFTTGGESIHKLIQGEFAVQGRLGAAEGVLVDPKNALISKVDLTLKDGTPVEVKSVSVSQIQSMSSPKFEHVAQLAYYVRSQGLERGWLMYVARESTGLRKVFAVDVNGTYRPIADVSTEYMQLRRGGVSPSKYNYALEEGISSYRDPEYYKKNFSKFIEETKRLQGALREMERKKDWSNTYRQLISGIYEKANLNNSGIQNNYDNESEWGSPTKKKLSHLIAPILEQMESNKLYSMVNPDDLFIVAKRQLEDAIINNSHSESFDPEKRLREIEKDLTKIRPEFKISDDRARHLIEEAKVLASGNLEYGAIKWERTNKASALRFFSRRTKNFSYPVTIQKMRDSGMLKLIDPEINEITKDLKTGARTTKYSRAINPQTLITRHKRMRSLRDNLLEKALLTDNVDITDLEQLDYHNVMGLSRKGHPIKNELTLEAKKEQFLDRVIKERDRIVQAGQEEESLNRIVNRRKFQETSHRNRKIDRAMTNIKDPNKNVRSFVENKKTFSFDKPITFFDLETSISRNTETPFIFEFAGARLDNQAVRDVQDLQKLEQMYRTQKSPIIKDALNLKTAILHSDVFEKIKDASSVKELIDSRILGKESFEYYSDKAMRLSGEGVHKDILSLVKEDIYSLSRSTHTFRDGRYHLNEKYRDFTSVSNLDDLFSGQKKMLEQIDQYFGEKGPTTLGGHNIEQFDVNKLINQSNNMRLELKSIRDLATQDKVDTLRSDIADRFFSRTKEVARDLGEDSLFANIFKKVETDESGRTKTLKALENLAQSMGFVSGNAGAHRASFDVVQQNIPVFGFMSHYLESSKEEQEKLTKMMLENFGDLKEQKHKRLLPELIVPSEEVFTKKPVEKALEKARPIKDFLAEMRAEAKPALTKFNSVIKDAEEVLNYFLVNPKSEQKHLTFMRKPVLGIAGIAAAGALLVGASSLSSFNSYKTSPIQNTSKVITHEDSIVFPDNESPTRTQMRAPTDFGSGYQGLKKILQAPAMKKPNLINLTGKVEKKIIPPTITKETKPVIIKEDNIQIPKTQPQKREKDLIPKSRNKQERLRRWIALNSTGSRPVFEMNKNRIGQHRMN